MVKPMFQVDAKHPTPLYHQLERSIRFAIATGKLGIGDQLPTVRQLAVDLRINANTVAKVYTELERSGVVETRRGVGHVCDCPAQRSGQPPRSRPASAGVGGPFRYRNSQARIFD